MNETRTVIRLRDCMTRSDGWGRTEGREACQRLLTAVEALPGVEVFRVSFEGVERVDSSFASETVVEVARRFRKERGVCIVDLDDKDIIENIDLAASKKEQPLFVWSGDSAMLIGLKPKTGTQEVLEFALEREAVRSVDYAGSRRGMSVSNASMKLKSLWEEGFLLRREGASESGGVEHVYARIG